MGLWDTVRGWFGDAPVAAAGADSGAARLPAARWLAADNNRFGVPVLDLHAVLGDFISTSRDPEQAEMAVSWGARTGAGLNVELTPRIETACDLALPAAADLPDGLCFVPATMEDKWVLAWRDGHLVAARSWTGEVQAVARATHTGETLRIEHLAIAAGPLAEYGDPVQVFEWLVRTHALGEVHPLPVFEETAAVLAAKPATVFGAFGRKAVAAAKVWRPGPPTRPLRTDGAVSLAVRQEDPDRLRTLAAEGHSLDSPGTFDGYTPLHIAAVKGALPLVEQLLALGATPDPASVTGATPLVAGIVHGAGTPVLDRLIAAGADPSVTNQDGFGILHAAAEVGRPELVPWALGHGAELEGRTGRVQTALHIAAGLGHVEVVQALLAAGADASADSPWGTPHQVATAEGHTAVVAALPAPTEASEASRPPR